VRTLLAGWLVGWVPLRFPACRACFFFETERRERECVSLLVSADVATSQILKPSLRSFPPSPFFLPSSSPCHSLLLCCCCCCCCCLSLSRVARALQYFPSSLFVFCCVFFVFVCVCERARDSRND
jgi:hypothetical protein